MIAGLVLIVQVVKFFASLQRRLPQNTKYGQKTASGGGVKEALALT